VAHVARAVDERPDARIVALTPQVVEACEMRALPYLLLDSHVVAGEVNQIAQATMKREYEWAVRLDESLAAAVPAFRESRFAPATALLYFLKRSLDSYLLPATVLRMFFERLRPSTVVVFERTPFCPTLENAKVQRPLASWLAPVLVSPATRIESLPDSELEDRERLHDVATRRTYVHLRRAAGRVLRAFKHARVSRPSNANALRVAWIGAGVSDIDDAIPLLERRGIVAVQPPRGLSAAQAHGNDAAHVAKSLRPLIDCWLSHERHWTPVDAISPSLRPLLAPFLRRWFETDVPQFWAQFLAARDWLSEGGFSAMAGAEVHSVWTSALFHAAHSLGLRRIARIHNGGLIMDLPPHDCTGPTQSDVFIVNGDGDVEYFSDLARRYPQLPRAVSMPVGSSRLERAGRRPPADQVAQIRSRLRRRDSRPIVLYVPTMLMGCYRYFCEGYTSDTAYIALQQRILRCFAEFPGVRVLYKPMSLTWTRDPMRDFIAHELPNVDVISGRLTELMWAVDAIVVDFSATAMTEVIFTDKPLLFHIDRDWARMVPEAKKTLEGRVILSESAEEFEKNVREFLRKNDFQPVKTQALDFIRLYCTHRNDGRSAERMADVVAHCAVNAEPRLAVSV